ncbi:transposase family protein [Allofrancisella guangzhouensis]|nr:transposase family protein [Allofrancisella guangzhouensis]
MIFSSVKDPRVDRTKKHTLLDIIALSICGIIAVCETFEEISDFGKAHIVGLISFLNYDTISCDRIHLKEYFLLWIIKHFNIVV